MTPTPSRYERFYRWAKARSPLVFAVGRLAMWCARQARRYPAWAVAYLALLAGLIVVGFSPAIEPYGPLPWVVAGLLVLAGMVVVLVGYAGFPIKSSDRGSQLRERSLRRRIGQVQASLHSENKATQELEVRESLRKEFRAMRWFHSIDFGDFASSGRFKPGSPQNITLFGAMEFLTCIDLHGTTVLDIGAVDGLASFGMKALGADRVVATDSHTKETFTLSRDTLGLEVEYRPGVQIKDLTVLFERGTFDLVLCAGVIYHMFNPASAFIESRKIIKEGGLFIVESAYERNLDDAAIVLNSEEGRVNELFTYSVPTRNAILGLMKLVGFDVLAIRTIENPDRITVLGRAVAPAEVRDRTPTLQRMHELDFCDFEFRHKQWIPAPSRTGLKYEGPEDEQLIEYRNHEPSFPYHPSHEKSTVGSTVWMSPEGNR